MRKVVLAEVNADSSPLFDRSQSRCSRHEYTYSCYLRLSCSDIVNFEEATQNHLHSVFFGNLACAFSLLKDNLLETAVKQCNHVNGTRDILLLWVPLQSPLQLQKNRYIISAIVRPAAISPSLIDHY